MIIINIIVIKSGECVNMQSTHIKFFKDDSGHIFVLFYKDGSVYIKEHKNNDDKIRKVSENVLPVFSVCNDNGNPSVIVKKTEGDICICRYKNRKWEERPFLKAHPYGNTKFYIHTNKDRMDIVYNCPSAIKGEETLNTVSFADKKWQTPVVAERIKPFSSSPYMVINITSYHLLVFCNKPGDGLVMKEMLLSPLRTGRTMSLFSYDAVIVDVSCVIVGDTVHIVFIAGGRRGSRLIYKQKNGAGFSENKVKWENGRINSCIIFAYGDRLWIAASVGSLVFCTFSDDNGGSFGAVFRHKTKFLSSVTKAEFISCGIASCSEVYIYDDTNEIAFMDEICYDLSVKEVNEDKKVPLKDTGLEEEIKKLRNKNEMYEKQINEANKKIGELSMKLAQRNEELSVINSRWMRRMNSFNAEVNKKYLPAVVSKNPSQGL